ncbi:MAG: HutD/Ves family protein [Bosea sp. (in: a-proteobacteria)]
MHITHLAPSSYTRSPWKNGGGVTVDMAEERLSGSVAGSWDGLIWRLGRTTISTPAPFSDLAGFDRCQVVIGGSGLVLDTPQGEVDLRQPFRPARYPGEAPISSRLENGPVEVANLIADRTRAMIRLDVLRVGDVHVLEGGICVLHAPTAAVTVDVAGQPQRIGIDHAFRLDGAAGRITCKAGIVLVASIRLI